MPSQIKYLFIFNHSNIKNNFSFGYSLRKGILFLLSLCYIYILCFLTFAILSMENKLIVLTKFFVFTILDFFSFHFLLKSTNTFSYRHAKKGLIILNLSIFLHILLLIMKFIIFFNFQSKISFFNFPFLKFSDHSEYYELFYIGIQMYFYHIGFSYTTQLSFGNDALVDGQEFDKYIENLAMGNSDDKSRISDNSFNNKMNFNYISNENINYNQREKDKTKNINLINLKRDYINSENSDMFN